MKEKIFLYFFLGIALIFIGFHFPKWEPFSKEFYEVAINQPVFELPNLPVKQERILIAIPNFIYPIETNNRISSNVGIRDQVITGMGGDEGDLHRGIDIVPIDKNAKVLASADGEISLHYPPPGKIGNRIFKGHPVFGALIVIKHENSFYTVYGHMKSTFVNEGQIVQQGQVIGIVGNTGKSTGTHLHFETIFDPLALFLERYQ